MSFTHITLALIAYRLTIYTRIRDRDGVEWARVGVESGGENRFWARVSAVHREVLWARYDKEAHEQHYREWCQNNAPPAETKAELDALLGLRELREEGEIRAFELDSDGRITVTAEMSYKDDDNPTQYDDFGQDRWSAVAGLLENHGYRFAGGGFDAPGIEWWEFAPRPRR
jgi:hypothetical protein